MLSCKERMCPLRVRRYVLSLGPYSDCCDNSLYKLIASAPRRGETRQNDGKDARILTLTLNGGE
jgi:hypothetical protein